MKVFDSPSELLTSVGEHCGYSEWITIEQERINQFAEATGDDQWIHVDVERAAKGPFGSTIAHGYLTMSLSNYFLPQIVRVDNASMGVNYGVNKVRFPAAVPAGSRVRAGAEIKEATDLGKGVQVVILITIELEGSERPACVIESVSRFMH